MAHKIKLHDDHNISTKRIAMVKCNISGCNKLFQSVEDRNWHIFNDPHNIKESKCPCCDLLAYSVTREEYIQHLETHKIHKCEQCDAKFMKHGSLFNHYRASHTKIIKCYDCEKMFWTQLGLDNHNHMPTFKCHKCPKMLTTEYRRERHELIVHSKKAHKVKCDLCDATFVTKYSKNCHIQSIHNGVKYECNICHIMYASTWYLKIHIKNTHDKSRSRNMCFVCNKSFTLPSTLRKHLIRYPCHKPHALYSLRVASLPTVARAAV